MVQRVPECLKPWVASIDGRIVFADKVAELGEREDSILEKIRKDDEIHFALPDTQDNREGRILLHEFLRNELEFVQREKKKFLRLLCPKPKPDPSKPADSFDLDHVKSIPIDEIHSFLKPTRFGNRTKAICPFHEERSASFTIFHDDNHFHCFGCQAHGDVIDFVMLRDKIPFKEACKSLLS